MPSDLAASSMVSPAKKRSFTTSAIRGSSPSKFAPAPRQGRAGRPGGAGSISTSSRSIVAADVAAALAAAAFGGPVRRGSAAWPRRLRQRNGHDCPSAGPSPHPPAGCTPRAPAPWPAASGPASPGPSWRRPASAVPRRPAARAARPPDGSPCSIRERISVTSSVGMLGHRVRPAGTVGSGSSPAASPRESSRTIALLHCPRERSARHAGSVPSQAATVSGADPVTTNVPHAGGRYIIWTSTCRRIARGRTLRVRRLPASDCAGDTRATSGIDFLTPASLSEDRVMPR